LQYEPTFCGWPALHDNKYAANKVKAAAYAARLTFLAQTFAVSGDTCGTSIDQRELSQRMTLLNIDITRQKISWRINCIAVVVVAAAAVVFRHCSSSVTLICQRRCGERCFRRSAVALFKSLFLNRDRRPARYVT